jgi:hypothetical protein
MNRLKGAPQNSEELHKIEELHNIEGPFHE